MHKLKSVLQKQGMMSDWKLSQIAVIQSKMMYHGIYVNVNDVIIPPNRQVLHFHYIAPSVGKAAVNSEAVELPQ